MRDLIGGFVGYSLIKLVCKFHRELVVQGAVEPLWVAKLFDVIDDLSLASV